VAAAPESSEQGAKRVTGGDMASVTPEGVKFEAPRVKGDW